MFKKLPIYLEDIYSYQIKSKDHLNVSICESIMNISKKCPTVPRSPLLV